MNHEDLQLDPETLALETELGSLNPAAPSEALRDRIFDSMDAGEVLTFDDEVPTTRGSRWWMSASLPLASAAAVALFAVLSPVGPATQSDMKSSVASVDTPLPVHTKHVDEGSQLAPNVMLSRASIDQELFDRHAEIVGAEEEGTIYRKVHTYQTERMRFFDKEKGVEVIAEVPCEEVRLEKVEAY